MESNNEYYVYVYIDPRNFEEFYYGKGKGSRMNAHLNEDSDTEKSKRIRAIKEEGLDPIIRVIARNLSEHDALLVEKTLLWKLGKQLTNISSGHYADNFRPHDRLHKRLYGFDYRNGVYYVNVGEKTRRSWDDCLKYGFICAGQGEKYSKPLTKLEIGDIVAAFLQGRGYVGIGKVIEEAVPINDFKINNKSLHQFPLKSKNLFKNSDNEKTEFVVKIEWIKSVERIEAKWKRNKRNNRLFSPQLVRASLKKQKKTLAFLEKEFNINFDVLLEEQ